MALFGSLPNVREELLGLKPSDFPVLSVFFFFLDSERVNIGDQWSSKILDDLVSNIKEIYMYRNLYAGKRFFFTAVQEGFPAT